ncbi:MAG: VCBS repeat-containing protein, partial [Thermoleophilia bacterium]|nr:VCBS repeat-containing protein [Thermoleophilia bacterium]
MLRRVTLRNLSLLIIVLGAAGGSVETAIADPSTASPTAANPETPTLLLDFEDGSLEHWRFRTGDEIYGSIALSEDSYAPGNRSLHCHVAGWDSILFEEVRLYYYPPDTVLLDADCEFSWVWWVGDRDESDGVGIQVHIQEPGGYRAWRLDWASHSLHVRGPWPYDDPEQQWVRHRASLKQEREDWPGPNPPPPFPWRLACVEIFFWFPIDQDLYIDDMCFGPPQSQPRTPQRIRPTQPVTPPATSVLPADLDGDGRLDWLVGCEDAPPLIWLGGMGPPAKYRDPSHAGLENARSLCFPCASDVDCDGIVDLVGLTDGRLRLYQGLGSGY